MARPTTRTEKYFLTFEGITHDNLKDFVEYFIDNESMQDIIQQAVDSFIEYEK